MMTLRRTRLAGGVLLVVVSALTPARADVPADTESMLGKLAPFRELLEPPIETDLPYFADPAQALIDSVAAFSADLGLPVDAASVIRESGISPELAARLAATLDALFRCHRITRAALEESPIAALWQAALAGKLPDPEPFAGLLSCAVDVHSTLGGLELYLASSGAASEPPVSIDLWPVFRLEMGVEDNVYVHDYVLLVDNAGDDTYANNAGSNMLDLNWGPAAPAPNVGPARGCQTALSDFQAGRCFPVAAALLDLRGDDTYGVFEEPDVDTLCTADPVVRRTVTAGVGLAGVGILRDVSGDDTHNAKSVAQGTGHIFGIGVLSDGGGNDSYLAVRNSQGFALLGGVGILHDESGNDTYDFYIPSPLDPDAANLSPGAGGIVDDIGRCNNTPRFLQGAGNLGQALGVLIDDQGDDTYRGDLVPTFPSSIGGGVPAGSQGFGAQGGNGILLDRGGDDTYLGVPDRENGATIPPGEESTGTGLFVDESPAPVRVTAVGLTSFVPAVVTVPVGGTVEWHNDGPAGLVLHTVTTAHTMDDAQAGRANDPGNDDGDPDTFNHPLPQGAVVSHTFNRPGTHHYFCEPHHAMGMTGTVIVTGTAPPAAWDETVPVWHDGRLFATEAGAACGQNPECCAEHQSRHTHVAAPGEGLDVSGWCDDLAFRQQTFTVPETLPGEGGGERTVTAASLDLTLRFASGNEPPTDQLPEEETMRGQCDVHANVTDAAGSQVASTLDAPGNTPFRSPHELRVPLTPGATYTITVDPHAGVHAEWRIDADLFVRLDP